MATNQETAAIKARMDRIPSALSPELVERIAANRASHKMQRRPGSDRDADKGTLMRPAFMRDTEKMIYRRTCFAGKRFKRSNDDFLRAISVAP